MVLPRMPVPGHIQREDFVTVSDVLNEAYRELYAYSHTEGLCILLKRALWRKAGIKILINEIQIYIPKFTRWFVGAPKERLHLNYWWDMSYGEESRTVRLEALAKLYNYYIDHDELILKEEIL